MHKLETQLRLSHPPEQVWSLIGDFGSLRDWLPGVRDCALQQRGDRTERVVALNGGQQVREQLLGRSDSERWYRYQVLQAPGLQQGTEFVATLSVRPDTGGSMVEWTAEFRLPDELPQQYAELMKETATSMYDAALANLEAVLNDAG